MASSINRILKGHKASYRLLEVLKEPSVFKAARVTSTDGPYHNNLVVKDLRVERELRAHQLPVIKECPYIRQVVDVIEKGEHEDWSPSPPTIQKRLVLEWMDTDLWLVRPFGKPFSNPRLPQIVARSMLEALLVFQRVKGVHTGVAKNNPSAQTHETRAPEVWKGLGVWHSSDMWSLGVTITHWLMSGTLFGPHDKIIEGNHTAWCLAKIHRLVGPIDMPENPEYKEDFEMGAALEKSGYVHPKTGETIPFITVGSLREELQKLPREICSEECIDFIEHLLVIDPAGRPTAEEAMKHPFVSSISLDQPVSSYSS
ncbi:conserved hypothetical protein [Microsporum canis CBS 113480]|uniref:Protein kinase domain-containing protein n=1 Tax=Arthroderma otae (strain ATCC MYA-4605 / CBS 113480) TaxID=554155 RepID=C5FI93_ARTOC|nr:conserved hypothetical protein [Microsporum canis CBS 113480]EEQ29073.1 conserved hypothetical protein [Microsporum canis CBS 113480]